MSPPLRQPPVVRYLDNGAAGFTTTGTWIRTTGTGRESDVHWAPKGTGSSVATWTFTGLAAGQYRVSATWPGSTSYASDAPFTVYNGTQFRGMSRANQKAASSGFADGGSQWKDLGNFTITGNTLVVKLTNAANGWVAADGIRIERIAASSIARSELPGGANLAGLLPLASPSAPTIPSATDAVFQDRANDAWLQASGSAQGVAQLWQNAAASKRADLQPELAALKQASDLLSDLAIQLGQPGRDLLSNLWD